MILLPFNWIYETLAIDLNLNKAITEFYVFPWAIGKGSDF